MKQAPALEHAIDDRLRQILVVKHPAPGGERLVGGEDHRATALVAIVDDVEEHVRRVGAVSEVSDFVDDQDVRVGEARERLGETTLAEGRRELVDEFCGGDEQRLEAVLDRPIGDGHGKVSLAPTGLTQQDETATLGDEVRRQRRAEQGQAHGRLVGEVELLDRLQERELCPTRQPSEAGVGALRDLLGDQGGEELVEGPLLGLGARDEIAPDAPGVGEVQALEQPIQIDVDGLHSASSCWRRSVLGGAERDSACAMYSAPNRRSVSPCSNAVRRGAAPWCWSSSCN